MYSKMYDHALCSLTNSAFVFLNVALLQINPACQDLGKHWASSPSSLHGSAWIMKQIWPLQERSYSRGYFAGTFQFPCRNLQGKFCCVGEFLRRLVRMCRSMVGVPYRQFVHTRQIWCIWVSWIYSTCTGELCSGGTTNLTFQQASNSLCLYCVGHKHNISSWAFANKKWQPLSSCHKDLCLWGDYSWEEILTQNSS